MECSIKAGVIDATKHSQLGITVSEKRKRQAGILKAEKFLSPRVYKIIRSIGFYQVIFLIIRLETRLTFDSKTITEQWNWSE